MHIQGNAGQPPSPGINNPPPPSVDNGGQGQGQGQGQGPTPGNKLESVL